MSEVPVRELNQDTAGVLARVKRGEHLDITERGVVIAHILPAEPSPFSELIASGRLHPATLSGPLKPPTGPIRANADAGSQVRADRDSERY